MKVLLTGMNGTVAPAIARRLQSAGHAVVRWDRSVVPIDDPAAIHAFIAGERPDWFLHVATGSPDWAEAVAHACAVQRIRFLLTSSVSVFSGTQAGPLVVGEVPDATDDYGRYKIECERRVCAANPDAMIVRLGWQIGDAPGSNNMIDYLHRVATADGRIEASAAWFPACSFLDDTADAIADMMSRLPAGLYHLDGNPGLSMFEIASGLNRLHGGRWQITPTSTPVLRCCMHDDRVTVRPITDRLSAR